MQIFNVQRKTIAPNLPQKKQFEVHRNHRDIFLILEGSTVFQYSKKYSPIGDYDSVNDVQKVEASSYESISVVAGEVIIFDAGEAHKPLLQCESPEISFIIIKEGL